MLVTGFHLLQTHHLWEPQQEPVCNLGQQSYFCGGIYIVTPPSYTQSHMFNAIGTQAWIGENQLWRGGQGMGNLNVLGNLSQVIQKYATKCSSSFSLLFKSNIKFSLMKLYQRPFWNVGYDGQHISWHNFIKGRFESTTLCFHCLCMHTMTS